MAVITRRRSLLVVAALVASGCVYLGATAPSRGYTQVHSAELSSATPMLGAFLIRVAASNLTLDAERARLTKELSHDADAAIRPVDEARTVFVEVLVRAVEARHYDPEVADDAAAALVATTRTAAPSLLASLAKLHYALDPAQRKLLLLQVATRFEGWSAPWNGGKDGEHPWLATFAHPAFPRDNAMVDDAVRTARDWTVGARAEVAALCATPSTDDAARRELIARLRK